MIFTDFAPNENYKDSILALKLLFSPWIWKKGRQIDNLKRRLKSRFFTKDTSISFFFTGRAALHQYLASLGLKKNDEIIVQAFTCEAVILPIMELGLVPKYVDIGKSDYSMDFIDLQKKITPKTKVIIIQHTFGFTPKDRVAIISWAMKHNLRVIEDLAHGFDQDLFRDKKFSSALLLSFGRSKSFSSVFGGAIAIRGSKARHTIEKMENNLVDPKMHMILKIILYKIFSVLIKSTYGFSIGKIMHFLFKQFHLFVPEVTKMEKKGQFNKLFLTKFPNSGAIMLNSQLDRFNDVYKIRKQISSFYDNKLKVAISNHTSLLRYPYLCESPDDVKRHALAQHIRLGTWYQQVVAPKEIDLDYFKYAKGTCPVAESLCERIINLPTNITIQEAEKIIKFLKKP